MDTHELIRQLTDERNRIDVAIRLLSDIGSTTKVAAKAPGKRRGRRRMSKEARARISAAQKARWAKARVKK